MLLCAKCGRKSRTLSYAGLCHKCSRKEVKAANREFAQAAAQEQQADEERRRHRGWIWVGLGVMVILAALLTAFFVWS